VASVVSLHLSELVVILREETHQLFGLGQRGKMTARDDVDSESEPVHGLASHELKREQPVGLGGDDVGWDARPDIEWARRRERARMLNRYVGDGLGLQLGIEVVNEDDLGIKRVASGEPECVEVLPLCGGLSGGFPPFHAGFAGSGDHPSDEHDHLDGSTGGDDGRDQSSHRLCDHHDRWVSEGRHRIASDVDVGVEVGLWVSTRMEAHCPHFGRREAFKLVSAKPPKSHGFE